MTQPDRPPVSGEPSTEAGRALVTLIGTKGWPATVRGIDRDQFVDFVTRIEAEVAQGAAPTTTLGLPDDWWGAAPRAEGLNGDTLRDLTEIVGKALYGWGDDEPNGATGATALIEVASIAAAVYEAGFRRPSDERVPESEEPR